jgi:hypothetical protein
LYRQLEEAAMANLRNAQTWQQTQEALVQLATLRRAREPFAQEFAQYQQQQQQLLTQILNDQNSTLQARSTAFFNAMRDTFRTRENLPQLLAEARRLPLRQLSPEEVIAWRTRSDVLGIIQNIETARARAIDAENRIRTTTGAAQQQAMRDFEDAVGNFRMYTNHLIRLEQTTGQSVERLVQGANMVNAAGQTFARAQQATGQARTQLENQYRQQLRDAYQYNPVAVLDEIFRRQTWADIFNTAISRQLLALPPEARGQFIQQEETRLRTAVTQAQTTEEWHNAAVQLNAFLRNVNRLQALGDIRQSIAAGGTRRIEGVRGLGALVEFDRAYATSAAGMQAFLRQGEEAFRGIDLSQDEFFTRFSNIADAAQRQAAFNAWTAEWMTNWRNAFDITDPVQRQQRLGQLLQQMVAARQTGLRHPSELPQRQMGTARILEGGLAMLHEGEAIVPAGLLNYRDTGPLTTRMTTMDFAPMFLAVERLVESISQLTTIAEQIPQVQPILPQDTESRLRARQMAIDAEIPVSSQELENIDDNTERSAETLEQVARLLNDIRRLLAPRRRRGAGDSGQDVADEPLFDEILNTEWPNARYGRIAGLEFNLTDFS